MALETHADWDDLRRRFVETVTRDFSAYMPADAPHFQAQLAFARGRFDEGAALLQHLAREGALGTNVLDIGSGNGGISFAFANVRGIRMHTLDLVPNVHLAALRSVLGLPLHGTVGDGAQLPFRDETFDVILLLDTIEHVERPKELGREIMRVLRKGGVCVVTTPARLRFAFARDPHYGVPGLVLLPNAWQRFIVNRLLRRRILLPAGGDAPAYDVTHLYWRVSEILHLFPSSSRHDVLFNRTYRPPGKFTIEWIRHPHHAVEQLRYAVRNWFFAGIVLWK